MSPKNCPDCGAVLGKGAYKCRCGWKSASQEPPARRIDCCYIGCIEPALVRVPTATGWGNVCLIHYPLIEIKRKRSESLTVREIREAYLKSRHAKRGGSLPPAKSIGEMLPREPGEDLEESNSATPALGIPLDDLEREFMDRSNP